MIPLYVPVFLPMLLGILGYFLSRKVYYWVLLLLQSSQIFIALRIFAHVREAGSVMSQLGDWPVSIGIALHADILSTVMILLTSSLFLFYLLYNAEDHYSDNLFMFLFMLMQSVLIALFLTNDLFNVYVLLELSMIIVSILIMYKQGQQSLYDGMVFIMINSVGMAFMLFGIAVLYRLVGVLDFNSMQNIIGLIDDKRLLAAPYSLIMTGLAVKSAVFPLFSWLPRAHGAPSAPSVVSAMLSGVLVKAGVFLLLRMRLVFMPAFNADDFFFFLAFVTAVAGFSLALCQNDLKLILAYHTVSQVGLIIMGLTAGNDFAYWGGVYHIVNHAFFKGLLFLSAGVIIEEFGTRDYTRIRGVFSRMPFIGTAALMGVLGITGAPFFNGSVSKYLIQRGLAGDFREMSIFLVNLGTIVSFVKYSSILPSPPTGRRFSYFTGLWSAIGLKAATKEASIKKGELVNKDRLFQGIVSILMGFVCFFGGIAGAGFIAVLFQIDLDVDGAFYLSKTIMFAVTFFIALLLYRFAIIPAKPFLKIIQDKVITFNDVSLLIGLFCSAMGIYVYFWA